MIYVTYVDKDGLKVEKFTDAYEAYKFIKKIKRRHDIFISCQCDDPEDSQFIWENI